MHIFEYKHSVYLILKGIAKDPDPWSPNLRPSEGSFHQKQRTVVIMTSYYGNDCDELNVQESQRRHIFTPKIMCRKIVVFENRIMTYQVPKWGKNDTQLIVYDNNHKDNCTFTGSKRSTVRMFTRRKSDHIHTDLKSTSFWRLIVNVMYWSHMRRIGDVILKLLTVADKKLTNKHVI